MLGYEDAGQVAFRLILLCTTALIVVRLMGNRTVGQLSPFDFVIMVGIGDVIVTVTMDARESIFAGVEGLLGLLLLQRLLSYLSLKSKRLRKWFEGTPVILIEDGQVIKENFASTHFNYDDLRQELHRQGMDITNLKDIKMARLESCGVFSVIKTREAEPLTVQDLEEYITTMYTNPLSPLGKQLVQLEQLMADVRVLADAVNKQQAAGFLIQTQGETGKELH